MTTTSTRTSTTLRLSDLIKGVMAALAQRGIRVLSARPERLDHAFAALMPDINRIAAESGLAVPFTLGVHKIHGDSRVLQRELHKAVKRDLISFDNPEFVTLRIKIHPEEAPFFMRKLPGSVDLYRQLADKFLDHYRG